MSSDGSTGTVKLVEYIYDHRGYRIKRTSGTDYTYFTFGLNGEILHKDTPTQTENYIYLFGKHLAKEITKKASSETKTRLYYHTDNLGSTIAITDTDGDKIWSNGYTSFGVSTNESGIIEEVGIFTGKNLDEDTGLYYFNARWYDPTLGRFITEDPIKDGNNWHVYCNNNPINFIDPTGLWSYYNPSGSSYGDNQGVNVEQNYANWSTNSAGGGSGAPNTNISSLLAESQVYTFLPASFGEYDLPYIGSFNSTGSAVGDIIFGFGASIINGSVVSSLNMLNNLGGDIGENIVLPILKMLSIPVGVVDDIMWDKLGAGLNETGANLLSAGFFPGMLSGAISQGLGYYANWGKAAFAAKFFAGTGDNTVNGIMKINGRNPINSKFAGKIFNLTDDLATKYPNGVKFTDKGFPDFSTYMKAKYEIKGLTGNYAIDSAKANSLLGVKTTPPGYVWHHVEDALTMQLVPQDLHWAVRHTGGAAVLR